MQKFREFNGYVFREDELVFIEPINEESCRLVFRNKSKLQVSLVRKRVNRNGKEVITRFSVDDIYRLLD